MSIDFEGPMISRRKALAGAAAAAGAGVLSACGAGGGSSTHVAVAGGASPLGGPKRKVVWALAAIAPWNLQIDVGFIDATKQLGWDYQKVGLPAAQYSPENVVNVINQAVVTKPDVLITPAWVPGVAQAAEAAQKAGILVIFNNADNIVPQSEKLGIAYVGANERAGGAKIAAPVAEALVKSGKKSGKLVAGVGVPNNENLNNRVAGALEGLNAFNQKNGTSFTIEKFVDESEKSTAECVNAYKSKILQEGSDLVGFLTPGGEGSLKGLVPALKASGKKAGQFPTGAWDDAEFTDKAVQEGWAVGIVDKEDYVTGYMPVFMAWAQLERGFPPRDYQTSGNIIDSSNVKNSLSRQVKLNALAKEYGVKLT